MVSDCQPPVFWYLRWSCSMFLHHIAMLTGPELRTILSYLSVNRLFLHVEFPKYVVGFPYSRSNVLFSFHCYLRW